MHNIDARIGEYSSFLNLKAPLGTKWTQLVYQPGSEINAYPADSTEGLESWRQYSSIPLSSPSLHPRMCLIPVPFEDLGLEKTPGYNLPVWTREGFLDLTLALCQRYGVAICPLYENHCIVCSQSDAYDKQHLSQTLDILHFNTIATYADFHDYIFRPRIAIVDHLGSCSMRSETNEWVVFRRLETLAQILRDAGNTSPESVLSPYWDHEAASILDYSRQDLEDLFTACSCNTALREIERMEGDYDYSILVVPRTAFSTSTPNVIKNQILQWHNIEEEISWLWEQSKTIPALEALGVSFVHHDQCVNAVSMQDLTKWQRIEVMDSALLVV